ncbi:hypothetical protein [Kurthia sibirica]|uniref:hypothetical protein n=1 Tax=Kurthia sibirica TaxID=202750 RepID=UPI0011735E12|nr:hypothetical protein [Kurthia sibirica]GEK35438.1 hypothetical protein KSI01_29710 [Kurthia sibirica]
MDRAELIIKLIKEGYSTDLVATKIREQGIPTSKKTVRKVLEKEGFVYDRRLKKWLKYPTNVKRMETNVKETLSHELNIKQEVFDLEPNAISLLNVMGLSVDQLNVLKQVANERLNDVDSPVDVHAAVAKLKYRDRGNKTFYISRAIAEDTAIFTERNALKLSHFVELALLEAMEKYGK